MHRTLNLDLAIQIADSAVFAHSSKHLSNIEVLVLQGSWLGKTYQEIATESSYNHEYLKNNVGPRLWKLLSEALGEKVSKHNLVAVLTQQAASRKFERCQQEQHQSSIAFPSNNYQSLLISPTSASPNPTVEAYPLLPAELDSPDRLVSPTSVFYVKRQIIEEQCCQKLEEPGALIRIKAPSQMGKTSLMLYTLDYARAKGFHTVALNLQRADLETFTNLKKFLQWFCAAVARQLRLPHQIDDYWSDTYGSKSNCTAYFEDCLLSEIDAPLALALDRVDQVFTHAEIAEDFFSLLRSWYEEAAYGSLGSELWQKLRLLIVHSTEVYLPLDTNQSPFNVGLAIELPPFNQEQVIDLVRRQELYLSPEDLEQLMQLLGGHPYLVRLALHHLAQQETTWEELQQSAATDSGIYGKHLHRHLGHLQQHPGLAAAYRQVVRANRPVELEQMLAFKLHSMGLVTLEGNAVTVSCGLYRQYFRDRISA
ncbi:MAG: hypothetical protein F6K58_20900 [Symploca sp. SIO2E9]|nr:hypothetical protein [Symploca sp. SIO2E9]